MSNTKFKYNPETLSYEEVKLSTGRKIFRVALFLAPSLLMGLVLSFFFSRGIESPRIQRLKSELKLTNQELIRLQKDMILANNVLDELQNRDENLYRAAFYVDSFPEELRLMGSGGSERYAYLADLSNSELITETSVQLNKLEKRLNAQGISFRELMKVVKNKEMMLSSIPAIQPVRNKDLKRTVSGYGWRIDPIYKTRKMHTGMDFTANTGTEIYATGDGVVEIIESKRWGYGKSIVINHGFGYKTRYAHLSAFKAKRGQKVKRGELIGLVGSTGKSTGPHLHYEVVKDGKKVNPIGYYHSDLSAEQYEQLLEMSESSFKTMD